MFLLRQLPKHVKFNGKPVNTEKELRAAYEEVCHQILGIKSEDKTPTCYSTAQTPDKDTELALKEDYVEETTEKRTTQDSSQFVAEDMTVDDL